MRLKPKMKFLQRRILTSKLGTLLSFVVACSLFAVAVKWFVLANPYRFENISLHERILHISEHSLAVFVLSNRDAFDRREVIRKTWAFGRNNVFFVVSNKFCPYPPENRIVGTCSPNNYSLTNMRLKDYVKWEDSISKKLLNEKDLILVATGDNFEDFSKKLTESYKWAFQTLKFNWLLHVEDTVKVELDQLEEYLKSAFDPSENIAISSSIARKPAIVLAGKKQKNSQDQFICGLNQVVSKSVAQYATGGVNKLFQYTHEQGVTRMQITHPMNIISQKYTNLDFTGKGNCKTNATLILNLYLKPNESNTSAHHNSVTVQASEKEQDTTYTISENPSTFLQSDRFDLIVKMVYAYFYVFKAKVPIVIQNAYTEHLRVWNQFKEYCFAIKKEWYDSGRPCKEKSGSSDFISSFQSTINTIRKFGFNSSLSMIPVDKFGFPLNGAHRIAASVVLSKEATFEHHNYERRYYWGYQHFKKIGLHEHVTDLVMFEWMKIQMQLQNLKRFVSIVSVFSNDPKKDEAMRKIVKEKCSVDDGILYEKRIKITKNGARQLITHMYGQQSWIETKITQMLSRFEFPTYNVSFFFVYSKEPNELLKCKDEIRKLYNDKIYKSTAHIPDTLGENLILAEMVLNPSSVQFMNHAKNALDCKLIAKEISGRSLKRPIKTLPEMYLGRDDVMIDSGTVLGFFGLRKRTDIDLLFLQDVDKSILGDHHGMNIQAHTFKFNSFSKERAWGEDHFTKNGPEDQWDLFYDPQNYGYCYGVKFVSLEQLKRYKKQRNEPIKDQYDVQLISDLLTSIKPSGSSSLCECSLKLYFICFIIFLCALAQLI